MILGFSGHIDILERDKSQIKEFIIRKLDSLKQLHKIEYVLTGEAQGADQLFIQACEELNLNIKYLDDKIKTEEKEIDQSYYSRQCDYLILKCDQFLVVWDGVFTEKLGGTSWLVRQLLKREDIKMLHHLIVPRESNPYPICSLNAKACMPAHNDLESKLSWVPAYCWVSFLVGGAKQTNIKMDNSWLFSTPSLWRSFIIPGAFAAATLILGCIGFNLLNPESISDNFYNSVDLLTLNGLKLEESNGYLEVARVTGLLTPLTALGFGLYAATANLRIQQTLKSWMKKPTNFVVISGNTELANNLASDLIKRGFKVLLLGLNQHNDELTQLNRNLLKKNYQSDFQENHLKKVVSKAGLVYLMCNDETNLKLALKLDSYIKHEDFGNITGLYIHLRKLEKAQFLHNNIGNHLREKLKIIDIPKNTVRRLLNHYPVEWSKSNTHILAIHIIEYNELSEALCEHLLGQLHIEPDLPIELSIYSKEPEKTKTSFFRCFNFLKAKEDTTAIENYIWGNWQVKFEYLDNQINFNQKLFNQIIEDLTSEKTVSLYQCSYKSTEAVSWLGALLPRLNQEKLESHQNFQVFCYLNHLDKKQEAHIERFLNKLAPNLHVSCFGNLLEECSYSALNDDTLDKLAMEIAAWYDMKYEGNVVSPVQNWRQNSYQNKRSNRQAADHLWMKWRWLLRQYQNEYPSIVQSFSKFKDLGALKLEALSEIEHRRWCADLLIQGYQVLPEKYRYYWKENKGQYKAQFYHKDLIPFYKLCERDKEKDADQIRGIPEFIFSTFKVNTDD